jgi:ABC-type Fe3+-hydroxamate transport system substrate-binding protein
MRKLFKDQLNNSVSINSPPRRIVSLVPSQTELLFDLGLDNEIVGITKFCSYPAEKTKSKIKIGGTKNFNIEKIREIGPDLIIANKEENYKEGVLTLQEQFPVWTSDINNLEDAIEMILSLGEITGRETESGSIAAKIKSDFKSFKPKKTYKVAYFIWQSPYMVAGGDTFINYLLKACGFINVFEHLKRYPVLTEEQIRASHPDVILLSSEPYPFQNRHVPQFMKLCPGSAVKTVDGEIFSWYGSRLLHCVSYFEKLQSALG